MVALSSRHPRDPVVRAGEASMWRYLGKHERSARAYARAAILFADRSKSAALYYGHQAAGQYEHAEDLDAAMMILEGFQQQWIEDHTPTLDLALAVLDHDAVDQIRRALLGSPGLVVEVEALEIGCLEDSVESLVPSYGQRVMELRRSAHALARLSSQDRLELSGPAVVSLASRSGSSDSPLLQAAAALPIGTMNETGPMPRPDDSMAYDLRPPKGAASDDLWPGLTRRRSPDGPMAESFLTPSQKFAALADDEARLWQFVDAQSRLIEMQLRTLEHEVDAADAPTRPGGESLNLPSGAGNTEASRRERARAVTQVRALAGLSLLLLGVLVLGGLSGTLGLFILAASMGLAIASLIFGTRTWWQARGAAADSRARLKLELAEQERRAAAEVTRMDRLSNIERVREQVSEVQGRLNALRRRAPLSPQPVVIDDTVRIR